MDAIGALQQMGLDHSTPDGIHANGVSACTGLRGFYCNGSQLGAIDQLSI